MRSSTLLAPALVAVLLAGSCSTDPVSTNPVSTNPVSTNPVSTNPVSTAGPRPVIVDYSPTLSDVSALLYVATHPDVDLIAVTLAGTGEADCDAGLRQTLALLVIAGRSDTPVGCGGEEPMVGSRDWPEEWRAAANNLTGVVLPGVTPPTEPIAAEELLARVLGDAAEPVTVITLGPLTNLGRVLRDEPELASHIDSIVTMGGAFDVAGNVEAAPTAEWNLHIDPESVRAVLESGVDVTFVGLDATEYVPGTRRTYARMTETVSTDAGEALRQLWSGHLDVITSDGWFLWDELAAVVALDPSVATFEDRRIRIDDAGATRVDPAGVIARVATAADPAAFERRFLEVFAGGVLPEAEPLSSSELAYLDTLESAMSVLGEGIDEAFATAEAGIGQPFAEVFPAFVDGLFTALSAMDGALATAAPPDEMTADHGELTAVLGEMIAAREAFTVAATAAITEELLSEDGLFEVFTLAAEEAGIETHFDRFIEACERLEFRAYSRGALAPICDNDGG